MIIRSLVGFKPKKFDLVHQTVFLERGVVWARDYRCSTKPLAEMEELEEVGFFMLGVRRLTLKGCIFPIFSTKSL